MRPESGFLRAWDHENPLKAEFFPKKGGIAVLEIRQSMHP
jgi:hypothetical protein